MSKISADRNQYGIADDKSQVFNFDNPDFPVYIRYNHMAENNVYTITDHWHDEIEFIYVTKGSMRYLVEGEYITLHAGEGVMVNSRKIHVGMSDNGAANDSYCVILHPMLLSTNRYFERKYIEPIIKDRCIPYIVLKSDIPWQKEVLDDIEKIYESNSNEDRELTIVALFFKIWQTLYDNLPKHRTENVKSNHHMTILKDMISFIHEHYREKISLEDICQAGGVGKTMGTNIFNMYVNKTPGEFLKDYRIQKSIMLLKETDMTVTEICYETGFAGASYFAETFKKIMNKSPLEYRRAVQTVAPTFEYHDIF